MAQLVGMENKLVKLHKLFPNLQSIPVLSYSFLNFAADLTILFAQVALSVCAPLCV